MMGILSNLFASDSLGVENAIQDDNTVYADVLGDTGSLGHLLDGQVGQAADDLLGLGGALDELTSGDGLGLQHILGGDSAVGQIAEDGGLVDGLI